MREITNLRLLREEARLSLDELGELTGRTKGALCEYELGHRKHGDPTTRKNVAMAFCIPEEIIFAKEVMQDDGI